MNYWSNYNKALINLNNKIIIHNQNNEFNFVEDSFYNHIHDILALVILKASKNGSLRILDYGSNILPWANLKNKINIDKLKVFIYDPFCSNNKYEKNIDDIQIYSSLESILSRNYDLSIFGSSTQYIENLFELLESNKNLLSKYILFTHTPLSIKQNFESLQFTGYKGKQHVRSIDELFTFFEIKGYKISFKSVIDNKFASVERKYLDRTLYTNILFSKK